MSDRKSDIAGYCDAARVFFYLITTRKTAKMTERDARGTRAYPIEVLAVKRLPFMSFQNRRS